MKQVWYCFLLSPANRLLWNLVSGVRGMAGRGWGVGVKVEWKDMSLLCPLPFQGPLEAPTHSPAPHPSDTVLPIHSTNIY